MTTLVIARHGNTFAPHETPTRVGARTDLPLVEKGVAQARALGRFLKENNLVPDVVYASHLQRTIQTAQIALQETGVKNPVYPLDIFNEIDYGPDENKPEPEVIVRIGAQALNNWDERGIVPDGWHADAAKITQNWIDFAQKITSPLPFGGEGALEKGHETILVVTSNGIARFAPAITGDFESFKAAHDLKLATGALAIFKYDGAWTIHGWNIKP